MINRTGTEELSLPLPCVSILKVLFFYYKVTFCIHSWYKNQLPAAQMVVWINFFDRLDVVVRRGVFPAPKMHLIANTFWIVLWNMVSFLIMLSFVFPLLQCSDGLQGNGQCRCFEAFTGIACHICSNPNKHGENCDEGLWLWMFCVKATLKPQAG